MQHPEAVEQLMVERYLLNELSPQARDAFEAHFFDCPQCAEELRLAALFIDATRTQFGQPADAAQFTSTLPTAERASVPSLRAAASTPPRGRLLQWTPAVMLTALAASLLVVAYQSLIVLPSLHRQVAEMQAPQVLPEVSLLTANSRGAGDSPAVPTGKPFLLTLDVPTQESFTGYTCRLLAPTGKPLWSVPIDRAAAHDTVTMRVPQLAAGPGSYTLVVEGNTPAAAPVPLARYILKAQSATGD